MNLSRLVRSRACTATLLALVIAAAYGGSVRNEFVHDDTLFMTMDPRVQSVRLLPRLLVESRWAFRDRDGRHSVDQYYRPLEPLPYAVSHLLFDGAAWPSHALNLLVHFGNCLLVLALLGRLLSDPPAALLGTLLFAIHPGYSEAVLWPAALGGLGAFGCTVAILLLHTGSRAARVSVRLLSALLFLCGLWFKETGVLAPVLLVLYDLLGAPDRGWARLWRARWSYAVLVPPFALYAALRWHALGAVIPGMSYVPLTGRELLLNAVALLPQYARTFLWPFDLNLYHDFDPIQSLRNWPFWTGAGILASAVVAVGRTARHHSPIAFGTAWALAALAPYLLVHVPQGNVFAERYLYDPAPGVCLVLAYGWMISRERGTWWHRTLSATATALLLLCLFLDVRRMLEWRDAVTLYIKTLSQSARAEVVRVNLAVRYLELKRYDDGIAVLKDLLAFAPSYRGAWYNLGLLYQAKGLTDEAIAAYESAQHSDPDNPAVWLNLGYLYDKQGRLEDAVTTDLRLVEMAPSQTEGWYNLALIAVEHGQYTNAGDALSHVLAIAPQDHAAQLLLARVDRRGDRPASADPHLQADTLRRCTAAKATLDAGRPRVAILTLKMAAWLDEASPLPHQYLANAYFLASNLRGAIVEQRQALERAPESELYRRNLTSLEQQLAARENAANREPTASGPSGHQ